MKNMVKMFDKNKTMLYNISRSHYPDWRRTENTSVSARLRRDFGEGTSDAAEL
jgi:protein-disulfide isomerase-like protein with CxxC motif